MSITRRGRHVMCFDLFPSALLYVKYEEVILALHSIVPAEDVYVVLESHTGVQRPLYY